MSRMVIDLDDELVAEAAKVLGTSGCAETVDKALREVLESRRRAPIPTGPRTTSEASEALRLLPPLR
jgi:Arc/MetJ family transcription regulator